MWDWFKVLVVISNLYVIKVDRERELCNFRTDSGLILFVLASHLELGRYEESRESNDCFSNPLSWLLTMQVRDEEAQKFQDWFKSSVWNFNMFWEEEVKKFQDLFNALFCKWRRRVCKNRDFPLNLTSHEIGEKELIKVNDWFKSELLYTWSLIQIWFCLNVSPQNLLSL